MLENLARAIATLEGFYKPGSVPQRLNNPGDLIFVGQKNATAHAIVGKDGKTRVYCQFATVEEGWEALRRQIRLDARRGLTLIQFIHKYAPASDANDPKSYAAFVARRLSVSLDTPLSQIIS